MNPTVPPMPDEAVTWAIRQALGEPAIARAWEGCFQVGRQAGYAEGFSAAAFGALVIVVAVLFLAVIIRETRPR